MPVFQVMNASNAQQPERKGFKIDDGFILCFGLLFFSIFGLCYVLPHQRAKKQNFRPLCREGDVPWAQCWNVPRGKPGLLNGLHPSAAVLPSQHSHQLMEISDMSNFVVFVQLGQKPNSREAPGWP